MKRWWSPGPLVGVVVPAYGVERWLDECLTSLVRQTHARWEAVVVDDGSTDRTGEIADAWAARDRRISVVHQPNAGLGAARNAGLAHVGGDYLAFLGRTSPQKGLDRAIEIARRSHTKLKIAARICPEERAYFGEVIAPLLAQAGPLVAAPRRPSSFNKAHLLPAILLALACFLVIVMDLTREP